jgi:hypothetical protein
MNIRRSAVRCASLLLLSALPPRAVDMPRNIVEKVRFIESADQWLQGDRLDQAKFIQAFYWTIRAFDAEKLPVAKIVVIHADMDMMKFRKSQNPYPVRVYYPSPTTEAATYEVWLFGPVTPEMMIVALANILQREMNVEDPKAERAMKAYRWLKRSEEGTVKFEDLKKK